MAETLRFDLLANDRASAVFDKVGRSAANTESTFSKVGRGMAAVGRVAAVGLAVGAYAGAKALGAMVGEARESEKVGKLTESIIKATGGAAKVSAVQVGQLATSISNKTGVDDEAIQSGSNLLLTFKNVRNEVGAGNKVFNEATQAAVDLSAAGFGSIEGSSKMLGKALNDPIAGISALGRAGVTFSEDQKAAIKSMVETGDVLGAQNTILKEVQSQVGGAAAATGTAMDKMKTSLGNLGETIGTSLLPLIDKGAAVGAKFIGGLTTVFQSGGLSGAINFVQQQIAGALPVIQAKLAEWGNAFVAWIGVAGPPMLAKFGELWVKMATWMYGTALPAIAAALVQWGKAFVEWVAPLVPPLLKELGVLAQRVFRSIVENLPAIVAKLRGWALAFVEWIAPLAGPIIAALARLTGRFALWVLTDGVPLVAKAFAQMGKDALGSLMRAMGERFGELSAKVGEAKDRITARLADAPTFLLGEGRQLVGGLIGGIGERFVDLGAKLVDLKAKVTGAFSGAATMLSGIGGDIVQGLVNGITGAASRVASAVQGLIDKIPAPIRKAMGIASPSKVMAKIGSQIGDGLAGGMLDSQSTVARAAGSMLGAAGVDAGSSALTLSSSGGSAATASIGGGGNTFTFHITSNDPDAVVAAIHQYVKRNGRLRNVAAA